MDVGLRLEAAKSTPETAPRQASDARAQTGPAARDTAAGLPFTMPWLLAPMEGVTDATFRGVLLAQHRGDQLGGAFTEFVRVVDQPLPSFLLQRHLGEQRFAMPVGLQLMGADLPALTATARRALAVGAPLIDLNFGCPAKGALRGCAGAAVLQDPRRLYEIVHAVVDAVGGERPVTAKIRAGYDDDSLLIDLCGAAERAGAALLTVHCRTRREAYQPEVDWGRIRRAVAALTIPVCGNGGVRCHADLQRMRDETGCRFVMVGHGALADPWIFRGQSTTAAEAAGFLLDYAAAMGATGVGVPGQVKRLKQLLQLYTAGGLVQDAQARRGWLREADPQRLLARLAAHAGAERVAPC